MVPWATRAISSSTGRSPWLGPPTTDLASRTTVTGSSGSTNVSNAKRHQGERRTEPCRAMRAARPSGGSGKPRITGSSISAPSGSSFDTLLAVYTGTGYP